MITVRNKRNYSGTGIYIGRPSVFGNPFEIKKGDPWRTREKVVLHYRDWLKEQLIQYDDTFMSLMEPLVELARKTDVNLICWCAPLACHGDVIKECVESIISTGQWEGYTL